MTATVLHPVEAADRVMADLWSKVDEMTPEALAVYAIAHKSLPPAEPVGFRRWRIEIADSPLSKGKEALYWRVPENTRQ